jgi:hypothetical protein
VGIDSSTPQFASLYSRLRAYDPSKTYSVTDYRISNVYDSVWMAAYAMRAYVAIDAACTRSPPTFPAVSDGLPEPPILAAGALATDICAHYGRLPMRGLLSLLVRNITLLNGTSGVVRLDANGDRIGFYWIANRYNETRPTRMIGRAEPDAFDPSNAIPTIDITAPANTLVFNDGTSYAAARCCRLCSGDARSFAYNG